MTYNLFNMYFYLLVHVLNVNILCFMSTTGVRVSLLHRWASSVSSSLTIWTCLLWRPMVPSLPLSCCDSGWTTTAGMTGSKLVSFCVRVHMKTCIAKRVESIFDILSNFMFRRLSAPRGFRWYKNLDFDFFGGKRVLHLSSSCIVIVYVLALALTLYPHSYSHGLMVWKTSNARIKRSPSATTV